MESVAIGELVTVAGNGAGPDAIVFDTPSRSKIIIAVMDPRRGPRFRTVHPATLTPRAQEGPNDPALRLLLRRTPPAPQASGSSGAGAAQRRSGFTRGTAHRPTGK
ncbi:MAG: hypothetical protein ACYC91_16180 [Solirubrobacteraceae bacterium]